MNRVSSWSLVVVFVMAAALASCAQGDPPATTETADVAGTVTPDSSGTDGGATADDAETEVPGVEPTLPASATAGASPTEAADEPTAEAASRPAATPVPRAADAVAARDFGAAPATPTGPLDAEVAEAVEVVFGDRLLAREIDADTFTGIRRLGASGDPRVAWWLTDLLRVVRDPDLAATLSGSLSELLGVGFDPFDAWGDAVDHLIAWDIAAPPDYLRYKRNVYTIVESRWQSLFVDDADIDWRFVSWGGVFIDDRPFGQTDEPCNCIPAVDDPATTDSAGGDSWLDDDTIVFGVVIGGQARAYPRSIMEVREMVNDSLGGRDFAMPYCTLCGSAQVFFTDELPEGVERPVMRTSGLLSRSNKVMYDVVTWSVFDTFTGRAVSGPLLEARVALGQASVLTTTWGDWKTAYPDTTVLAIDEALGRPDSDLRNTRDAGGPIFPIGDVDPRLAVQADVVGVFDADGNPLAFAADAARAALEAGEVVEAHGVRLLLDGGGLGAVDADGSKVSSHQAFWFAWSQFHPETALWTG